MLETKFGSIYLIAESQVNTMRNQQTGRKNNSKALVRFSTTITNVVSVLRLCNYEGYVSDLRSSATLKIAIEMLLPNLKAKWWFYVDETDED